MKQIIFLLIILPFLSYTIGSEEVSATKNVTASITPRVLGGRNGDMKEFGYQVSLRIQGTFFCSAAAISQFDILGTAWCFTHHPNQRVIWPYTGVTVHSGSNSIRDLAHPHGIIKVTVHPGWVGTMESSMNHNIAHVKLDNVGIQFDDYQWPLSLPENNLHSMSVGYVSGWGSTSAETDRYSNMLKVLRMRIFTYAECQPYVNYPLHTEQLCAVKNPGKGCSTYDSGAPLVTEMELIGIHSWVPPGCCGTGRPDIFTNVYAERDFIGGAIAQFQ